MRGVDKGADDGGHVINIRTVLRKWELCTQHSNFLFIYNGPKKKFYLRAC